MFDVAICDDCGVDRLCLKALIEKAEIDKNLIRILIYCGGFYHDTPIMISGSSVEEPHFRGKSHGCK